MLINWTNRTIKFISHFQFASIFYGRHIRMPMSSLYTLFSMLQIHNNDFHIFTFILLPFHRHSHTYTQSRAYSYANNAYGANRNFQLTTHQQISSRPWIENVFRAGEKCRKNVNSENWIFQLCRGEICMA